MMDRNHDGHKVYHDGHKVYHDGHQVYHDDHSNETLKTNSVLLRNRQIHDIIGQISPSYVSGRHGLWPSL